METQSQHPVPGPHLHLTTTPADQARPSFRDLAKHHARAAAELATDADEELARGGAVDHLIDLAQTHALTSIACAQVAPVARQRLMPCKTGGAK